jgi:hypothetical protein
MMKVTSNKFEGGIEDHGDFDEGYCFKIKTYKLTQLVWILCTYTREEKINWMNSLYKLKELYDTKPKPVDDRSIKQMMEALKKGISPEIMENIKSVTEPTWIAISEWSQCSKQCGGGKAYLQRICAMPNGAASTCLGERILEQDCNTDPCYSHGQDLGTKFIPVSRKPNKYERCIIKEGDLSLLIQEGSLKGTKIPVRTLMNNHTLTLYTSDVIVQ